MPHHRAVPPSNLPAVLRLPPYRTVLPLGPGGRLFGLDPAIALAVDDLSPALAGMLDELAAPAQTDRLVAGAVERGADGHAAGSLLRELMGAGALVDAAVAERGARRRAASIVVVTGAGPLAIGIIIGLHHAGVGAVHVDTGGTVSADDLGTGFLDADRGRDRLDATRTALGRLLPGTPTGAPPLRVTPDLVVLADTAPDPVRVAELHATGTAHLAARLRDGVGVVGPLVLPGRSACLGCLELHRGARDPDWPWAAAGLVGRPGHADPACTAATAALATAQALAALDGPANGAVPPPTLDATLELDITAGTLVQRRWEPAQQCRCGAASTHGGRRHGPVTSGEARVGDTIGG